MQSLTATFSRVAIPHYGLSPLAVMFWMVAIDEDREQRERKKKRRRERQASAQPRPRPRPPPAHQPF